MLLHTYVCECVLYPHSRLYIKWHAACFRIFFPSFCYFFLWFGLVWLRVRSSFFSQQMSVLFEISGTACFWKMCICVSAFRCLMPVCELKHYCFLYSGEGAGYRCPSHHLTNILIPHRYQSLFHTSISTTHALIPRYSLPNTIQRINLLEWWLAVFCYVYEQTKICEVTNVACCCLLTTYQFYSAYTIITCTT